MNNKTIKTKYLPPMVEVIEVENEGVIASSLGDYSGGNPALPGGNPTSRSAAKSNIQSANALTDLEDLINNILTIEN